MASKGEVRKGVEKYLRSKFSDYNNSVGQFDRVIMGVLSTMGSTLLQPDDPKFDHHIGLETERMLKKYGPGTDYYNERFGKKGKNNDSANGSVEEYYSKMVGKSKSEVEKIYMKAKGNPNAEAAYKKWLSANDSVMVYDPVMCMMVPVKDQRTVDSPLDIFADIDSDVKEDLAKFKKAIDNAKTAKELENIENAIRNELSQVIDEYLSIWNEVGKYAQRSKNDAVIKFNSLATMAFKKYNSLSGK